VCVCVCVCVCGGVAAGLEVLDFLLLKYKFGYHLCCSAWKTERKPCCAVSLEVLASTSEGQREEGTLRPW
jgi:hypothetical protein